jgi:hypothetical protein
MTQPIDPTSPIRAERRVKERRSSPRRQVDRRASAEPAGLPVTTAAPPAADANPPAASAAPADSAAFNAQVLGQHGQKRGLKGGPPVLNAARAAYLGVEWSGPSDRRKATGKVAKKEL